MKKAMPSAVRVLLLSGLVLLLGCDGIITPHNINPQSGTITTVAGSRTSDDIGDGDAGVLALLHYPTGLAADARGNLYIADQAHHCVRKLNASGIITTCAGTGEEGFSGDGGQAAAARFFYTNDVAVDAQGNLYVADLSNHRIRRIAPDGTISTAAGSGTQGFGGDGGPADEAALDGPSAIDVDAAGNLYLLDRGNLRVRKVDTEGIITTLAGTGVNGSTGDGGPADEADLYNPEDVAVDTAGNVYLAEYSSHRIRRVDGDGIITTFAGTGTAGFSGDGGQADEAELHGPNGVALDAAGNVYISDHENYRIRRVDGSGRIATIAGTGTGGWSGDNGPAIDAELQSPTRLAVDNAGNLFICESDFYIVRKVTAAGIITTVAGTIDPGFGGDNGLATAARLQYPAGMAFDAAGNLYIADSENYRIRRVDAHGLITTAAGAGPYTPLLGGGDAATAGRFGRPCDAAFDQAGNMYVSDFGTHRIWKIDASGFITTFAGDGTEGFSGDGGPAAAARFRDQRGIAVDAAGNLYVADMQNFRIRKVDASTRVITTAAGNGTEGFGGDGGPATSAQLNYPTDVAVDGRGNIFIADRLNHRIRMVDASTGVITTVAGTGATGRDGDNGPAVDARLSFPTGVAVNAAGVLHIADSGNNMIRQVGADGIIRRFAGSGFAGKDGDGGQAIHAELAGPCAVAFDAAGSLYIADMGNDRIRKVWK